MFVFEIEVPVFWQGWNNVEWFHDIDSEICVQLSYLWLIYPFINIDDIPLLSSIGKFI
jgi:hypothetical protein